MANASLNIGNFEFDIGGGGGGIPEGTTYVIDSSQALTNWITDAAGNDYTHIYIAPGRHVIDYTLFTVDPETGENSVKMLDSVNVDYEHETATLVRRTKTIIGAPGAIICDDGQTDLTDSNVTQSNYLFQYEYSYADGEAQVQGYVATDECSIKNVTFELKHSGIGILLYGFRHIENCTFKVALDTVVSDVYTEIPRLPTLAQRCTNIINCNTTYGCGPNANFNLVFAEAFLGCNNISNCDSFILVISHNVKYTHELKIYDSCSNINNCNVDGAFNGIIESTIPNKGNYNFGPAAFCSCDNLTLCVSRLKFKNANNKLLTSIQDCNNIVNCCAPGFSVCYRLFMCRGVGNSTPDTGSAQAYFDDCFMDLARTIPADDTATGGYNYMTTTNPGGGGGSSSGGMH